MISTSTLCHNKGFPVTKKGPGNWLNIKPEGPVRSPHVRVWCDVNRDTGDTRARPPCHGVMRVRCEWCQCPDIMMLRPSRQSVLSRPLGGLGPVSHRRLQSQDCGQGPDTLSRHEAGAGGGVRGHQMRAVTQWPVIRLMMTPLSWSRDVKGTKIVVWSKGDTDGENHLYADMSRLHLDIFILISSPALLHQV